MTSVLATEATLRTLEVTIKSLTVSGKQMTLAVFRQLPGKSPLAGGSLIQGASYWGVVHYKIKDEGNLWVVFVLGGVLHRGNVWWPRRSAIGDLEMESSDLDCDIARLKVILAVEQDLEDLKEATRDRLKEMDWADEKAFDLREKKEAAKDKVMEKWECYNGRRWDGPKGPSSVREIIRTRESRRAEIPRRISETNSMNSLMELPQLFIAV